MDLLYCHKESSHVNNDDNTFLDEYINFERRDNMGSDYIQVLMENGYAILFSSTSPLMFILLMINMQIVMNTDLVNIVTKTKKCIPQYMNNIGIYE